MGDSGDAPDRSHRELHYLISATQGQLLCFSLKHGQKPKDHLIFKENLQLKRKRAQVNKTVNAEKQSFKEIIINILGEIREGIISTK